MNREIKFRAWDAITKDMIYPQGTPHKYDSDLYNSAELLKRYSIVMQYIGIEDAKGIEIYERDIVKWDINGIQRVAPVYYDERQAAFWMGKDSTTGQLVLNDWMRGVYEVIGNIHEHPELLNQ